MAIRYMPAKEEPIIQKAPEERPAAPRVRQREDAPAPAGRACKPIPGPKKPVSLRLDPDVIEYFKSTGEGWQTRMNAALRKAAGL